MLKKLPLVLGLEAIGGNIEAPANLSEKLHAQAKKKSVQEAPEWRMIWCCPPKRSRKRWLLNNPIEKVADVGPSEKTQLMTFAIAIYEKGFLHG